MSHLADMMANMRTERDVIPPGYCLLPFLRCPQSFLFLFALHKVTAISGSSDIHSQLFRGRQRRGPLENGNQSVAGKSFLTDMSGWLAVRISASQCSLLLHTTAKPLLSWTTRTCHPTIPEFSKFYKTSGLVMGCNSDWCPTISCSIETRTLCIP